MSSWCHLVSSLLYFFLYCGNCSGTRVALAIRIKYSVVVGLVVAVGLFVVLVLVAVVAGASTISPSSTPATTHKLQFLDPSLNRQAKSRLQFFLANS